MTPEEKKRREEEERAKFVTPTMVPPPPRPQEPQIQQQPQNPSVPKMFGDMMKAKLMEKAVTTAMGIPLPFMQNGGSVPYFQIGGNSGKYPGGLSPAGMIRQFMRLKELDDAVKSKGRGESPIPNPKMPALGAPGPRMVRAQEGQKIPKAFVMPEFMPKQKSNENENYFQRFERTGQLGTGIPNVYVTPQRQGAMVSYERNDVLPFTSIWNMMFNKSMKEKK